MKQMYLYVLAKNKTEGTCKECCGAKKPKLELNYSLSDKKLTPDPKVFVLKEIELPKEIGLGESLELKVVNTLLQNVDPDEPGIAH